NIPKGHEARFLAKLKKAFPETEVINTNKHGNVQWMKIAAILVVMIAVSFFGYQNLTGPSHNFQNDSNGLVIEDVSKPIETDPAQHLTLADISPDLKKVEEYYI